MVIAMKCQFVQLTISSCFFCIIEDPEVDLKKVLILANGRGLIPYSVSYTILKSCSNFTVALFKTVVNTGCMKKKATTYEINYVFLSNSLLL